MKAKARFVITEFANSGGSVSWRVSGTDRHGTRIRSNYSSLQAARAKQIELESDYLQRTGPEVIRATTLTDEQLHLAQAAFMRLDRDQDILPAVEHWLRTGKQHQTNGNIRLDEAVAAFADWLDATPDMRKATKINLRSRVRIFAGMTGNIPIASISPEVIEQFLDKRGSVSATTRDNDRRALSRFFRFCIDRPRRWIEHNPCAVVTVATARSTAPEILDVDQCRRLLDAARTHKSGKLLGYVALGLFGGLRPFEAARLTWDKINLVDNEIRIEADISKTGRPRTIELNPTLRAWLELCDRTRPFAPGDWDNELRAIREAAEIEHWPHDVLRHTGISHYWRKSGSYGITAQWAGNSESIIRDHYQARVSSEQTKQFFGLLPQRKGGLK